MSFLSSDMLAFDTVCLKYHLSDSLLPRSLKTVVLSTRWHRSVLADLDSFLLFPF